MLICGNMNAQSNDGISFHNKDSGLKKRIFIKGEDLSVTINLPYTKGKDVRTYVFNPHGEMVKDTTVNYESPVNLDIDEKIKGEYTVISNIKGDSEVLRYSAAIVDSEKEGKKFEFYIPEKAGKNKVGKQFYSFVKGFVDANKDGHLENKELIQKRDYSALDGRFEAEDNKLALFYEKDESELTNPKIKVKGKQHKNIATFEKVGRYGVVDFSKVRTKHVCLIINGVVGITGVSQKK